MIDSQYLLPFDLFQQIVLWISLSMHVYRKGRHYLETNLVLLHKGTDRELERLINAHAEDEVEMRQQMRGHLELIRDARRRGGTPEAIREAYINAYGGFTLDPPGWLAEIEQHHLLLVHIRRPDRTNRTHIALLRQALTCATYEGKVAPEIIAEIQNELGHVLVHSFHYATEHERLQSIEEAITYHKEALSVFTLNRYPLQYARTIVYLGLAYQRYGMSGFSYATHSAINCYEAALQIYARDKLPECWAMLQTYLGTAYTELHSDKLAENIEHAIAYHKAALERVSNIGSAVSAVWATAQTNLGDAYRQRIYGQKNENLEQAKSCYLAALQVYNSQQFPKEWAAIHNHLATIFQDYIATNSEQQDMYLRCALVCCESALQVFSPESFPAEYAATQAKLGHLHYRRPGGDHNVNLEQAWQCYRNALTIFTQPAFPARYQELQHSLADVEVQLLQHEHAFTLSTT